MKRKHLILGVGLGLAALALAAVFLDPTYAVRGYLRGEPFFAGRPVTYWKHALLTPDPVTEAEAVRRLQLGGAAAVPVLVALLGESGPPEWEAARVRWKAASLLGQVEADGVGPALVKALGDEDPHVRVVALAAVGSLSPPPAEAVGALGALLPAGDRESVTAARALGKIGADARDAVPALIGAMGAADLEVRRAAIKALGKVGPDARAAIPALTAALKDGNEFVREHSAESLGQIGPEARSAIPALIGALGDAFPKVRRDAARSLGQLGPDAAAAVPLLRPLLKDENELVRLAAAAALRKLDPAPAP